MSLRCRNLVYVAISLSLKLNMVLKQARFTNFWTVETCLDLNSALFLYQQGSCARSYIVQSPCWYFCTPHGYPLPHHCISLLFHAFCANFALFHAKICYSLPPLFWKFVFCLMVTGTWYHGTFVFQGEVLIFQKSETQTIVTHSLVEAE